MLRIQPGTTTERLGLHDHLPGLKLLKFCDFKLLHQSRSSLPTGPITFVYALLHLLTFCALAFPTASPALFVSPSKHRLLVVWKHHTPQNTCVQFVCTPEICQLHGWAINSSRGALQVTRGRLGHNFKYPANWKFLICPGRVSYREKQGRRGTWDGQNVPRYFSPPTSHSSGLLTSRDTLHQQYFTCISSQDSKYSKHFLQQTPDICTQGRIKATPLGRSIARRAGANKDSVVASVLPEPRFAVTLQLYTFFLFKAG